MKNPRLEAFRTGLKYLDQHSSDEGLMALLQELDALPLYEPEPYDIVRANCGQGECLYGMVLHYNAPNGSVSLATEPVTPGQQPTSFIAALSDCTPATPEQARAYVRARSGGAP